MTEWDELTSHPAWQRLRGMQEEKRAELVAQLITLGAASTDARVIAVARQIVAIDDLLRIPEEEAEFERSNAGRA